MRKLISTQVLCLVICMLALFNFQSCKKSSNPPVNNNVVSASVIVSPTQTIPFQFTGDKAHIGCGFTGNGPSIWGETDAFALLDLRVSNSTFTCVVAPGTYPLICEYRKNTHDPAGAIFSNFGRAPGSITFTVNDGNNIEGFFSAISWCQSTGCNPATDSVIVSGTFKGNIQR